MTHAGRAFRHMQEVAERLALGRECAQSPTVSKDSLHYGQRKSGEGALSGILRHGSHSEGSLKELRLAA